VSVAQSSEKTIEMTQNPVGLTPREGSIPSSGTKSRTKSAVSRIVAICRRGAQRQKIPILDLPLPSPQPDGWEWIAAYRHWARGGASGRHF
jgi:hypothetical protein